VDTHHLKLHHLKLHHLKLQHLKLHHLKLHHLKKGGRTASILLLVESHTAQFLAHYYFYYILMICQSV
jgi:hypothetical protein